MRKRIGVLLVQIILFGFLFVPGAFAANTTIEVSPQSGSFGKAFPVNVIIDGKGEKFNAAEAAVTLSSNLKLQDIVLGDCNFSFLKTPSVQDPSFAGVILSDSSNKCIVYTATVVPVEKGKGTIALTKASVRRYGDGANILSSTKGGTYTLSAAVKPPSVLAENTKDTSKKGFYTVNLTVFSSAKTPIPDASIMFSSVSKKNQQQKSTNTSGVVSFTNIKPGVYDATVQKDSKKIGETIINVSGPNHVLTLGINIENQKNNPLLKDKRSLFIQVTQNPLFAGGILVVGILVGVGIALLIIKLKR